MGGKSRICKAVEKDKNCNESVPTNHKFFRIMIGDFRTKLKIPNKFMANFNEKMPAIIRLQGPSGSIQKVKVRRTNGDVILCNGWDQFVKEHVEETDVVVFRYAGNSTFKVLVFDASGCERDEGSAFEAAKGEEELEEVEEDEEDEDGDGDGDEDDKKEGLVNRQNRKYFFSSSTPVTHEEKITAKQLAKNYTTQTHKECFFVVMKPTHVLKFFTLKIPRSWAFQHLPIKNLEFVELRVPPNPKTWLVYVTQNKQMYGIRVGWSKFVLENNLELGDACVFELCESSGSNQTRRKVVFDVIIYRAVPEVLPLSVQKRN